MRTIITIAVIFLTTSSFADEMLSGKDLVTGAGQPFCTDKDELQEFLLAMVKKDAKWMSELRSCISTKAGLKVAIIEDFAGADLAHVVKARIFTPKGSAVGYTLSIGMTEKP